MLTTIKTINFDADQPLLRHGEDPSRLRYTELLPENADDHVDDDQLLDHQEIWIDLFCFAVLRDQFPNSHRSSFINKI